jgi:hypothetical protein
MAPNTLSPAGVQQHRQRHPTSIGPGDFLGDFTLELTPFGLLGDIGSEATGVGLRRL